MVAKFSQPLPAILQPVGDKCIPLVVPDDPDYITALVEVLRSLTLDRTWARDENNSAEIVREVWRDRMFAPLLDAITSLSDCSQIQLPESGDCEGYPSSVPFVTYSPQNPFSQPNLVPDGYLTPPFTKFSNFALIGWLSTWLPEFTESLTGYQPDDIIVDISSMPLLADFQDLLNGIFPQIAINVTGTGIAELHLLNFPLGGRAIITVDVQPNIADIFLGILGAAETSIELNRDLLSLPIESNSIVISEVEITDAGSHTIYITFVPVVDDALIPINFGGGFRKIVLCGLDSEIVPIVEDVRIQNCNIEMFINGQWIVAGDMTACIQSITNPIQAQVNANTNNIATNTNNIATNTNNIATNTNNIATNTGDISDLETRVTSIENVDLPQIALTLQNHETRIAALEAISPTGGTTAIKTTVLQIDLKLGLTDNATAWTESNSLLIEHTFTKRHALVFADMTVRNSGVNPLSTFALRVGAVISTKERTVQGDVAYQTITLSDIFDDIVLGANEIAIRYKASGTNTVFADEQTIDITIIEYDTEQAIEPPSSNYLVDFDGGWTYTLGASDTGVLSSGGVEGNCWLNQSMAVAEILDVIADNIPETQIDNVTTDVFVNGDLVQAQLYINDIIVGTHTVVTQNQWVRLNWSQISVGEFPHENLPAATNGVRLVLRNLSSGSREARIDNIEIYITT